ncbi:MAG: type IV toxin-antitoxin system AbiEi family antitoxin [Deltaproteobacteria bacterium]|nr:type IV toxin-antitoxin system AbiEi family antitoxin [Deltaproteobacteria bacterium]
MLNYQAREPFPALSSWVDSVQSKGRYFFTSDQAIKELQATKSSFNNASLRLANKKRIARLYRGFYIIIPLEYANTGMLPPDWFIADLMNHIKKPYYVSLLSAATLHGAAHQQPQEFQVITTDSVRKIELGNLAIQFFVKKNFDLSRTSQVKTQTGYMAVSTPEMTALDLVCYARQIGGLDRVLTVFQELGEALDADKLAAAAQAVNNLSYAQRLGWLLEQAGFNAQTEKLAQWIKEKKPLPARLDPSLAVKGARKNDRWSLLINTTIEGDL